jgi:hypothetical protein
LQEYDYDYDLRMGKRTADLAQSSPLIHRLLSAPAPPFRRRPEFTRFDYRYFRDFIYPW